MQRLIRSLQGVTVDPEDYQRKRDFLYDHLTDMGYFIVKPQGAFYLFPKTPIDDDVVFVGRAATVECVDRTRQGFRRAGPFPHFLLRGRPGT